MTYVVVANEGTKLRAISPIMFVVDALFLIPLNSDVQVKRTRDDLFHYFLISARF